MKITSVKLRQIIREELRKVSLTEAKVINYKNGVTARIGSSTATLSHPKYGNKSFRFLPNYNRYKAGDDELGLMDLINSYAAGKLGKGDTPYKKIEKGESEPSMKPKEEPKFVVTNYKNGVVQKKSSATGDVTLSHSKRNSLKAKYLRNYNRYRPEGSDDEYSLMDLVKGYADGKIK